MKTAIIEFMGSPIAAMGMTVIVFYMVYKCLITLFEFLSYYNDDQESE
jgi:hypothetical protein